MVHTRRHDVLLVSCSGKGRGSRTVFLWNGRTRKAANWWTFCCREKGLLGLSEAKGAFLRRSVFAVRVAFLLDMPGVFGIVSQDVAAYTAAVQVATPAPKRKFWIRSFLRHKTESWFELDTSHADQRKQTHPVCILHV